MNKETRYIPLTKWGEYHVWPKISRLRTLVFNRNSNGFSGAVKKVGATILIDEQAFFEWVENNQPK